ncbi:MAG: hypothetical protein KAU20_01735, partial [Nanoarchaeota archaeon]|nr:hypothetical protein [Nanoarchaeota archaeon]
RNAMRGLTADWKEGSVAVGQEFIPMIEELVPLLRDGLGDVLPEIQDLASSLADALSKDGGDAIDTIKNLLVFLLAMGEGVVDLSSGLLTGINAVTGFHNSIDGMGDSVHAALSPVTYLLGAVLEFPQAYGEAQSALNDWEEAENNAAVTQQAATITQALYTEAMEGTAEEAAYLIQQYELLESQGANVGDLLDNLRIRHEELTHEIEIGSLVIGELSAKTAELSIEEIDTARSSIKLALAQMEVVRSMGLGGEATKQRIADLREYRDQLDILAEDLGAEGGGGAVGGRRTPEGKPIAGDKERFDIKAELASARETANALGMIAAEKAANILQHERDLQIDLEALRESKTERILEMEEEEWNARIAMAESAAVTISDFMIANAKSSFSEIGENFAKMIEKMALEALGSGLIDLLTSFLPGGKIIGLAGKMLKGK